MKVRIDALDTLFFRDGKPFSLGEETWAEGVFPPAPSVLYGSLRSWYFALHPSEIIKAGTVDDPTKNLKIKGIHFLLDDELHFVCPLDYVQEKTDFSPENYLLELAVLPKGMRTSYKLTHWLKAPAKTEVENIDGIIDAYTMESYAVQHAPYAEIKPWGNYVQTEPKVGIGRNKATNATQDGLLYRVGMVRPAYHAFANQVLDTISSTERLSIVIDFEGLPQMDTFPPKGFFKMGGEGKTVQYEIYNEPLELPSRVANNQTIFKLVLLAPAIFKKGWYPEWLNLDEQNKVCKGNLEIDDQTSIEVELLAAVMGKPEHLGGFDIKRKRPKPMYKAVPAGSVYYFRLANAARATQVKDYFQHNSLSDIKPEEGFGITLFTQPPL